MKLVRDRDDLCSPGIAWVRGHGLEIVIDVPTFARRSFPMDYGRFYAVRRVWWWVRISLFRRVRIYYGAHPGKS